MYETNDRGGLTPSAAHEQSMLEHNRVIFREVSRDQLVSDYYLLVLYMSGACSNTSSVDSGLGPARIGVTERVRASRACSKRVT